MDYKSEKCVVCNNDFTKRMSDGKVERRRSISSSLRIRGTSITASAALTALSYLYKLDITDSGCFLCSKCFLELERQHRLHNPRQSVPVPLERMKPPCLSSQSSMPVRRKNVKLCNLPVAKSPLYTCTSKVRYQRRSLKSARGRRSTNQDQAAKSVERYLRNYMYMPALRKIWESGKAARNAFRQMMQKEIRKEIRNYIDKDNRCEGMFPKLTSSKDIENFSWSDLLSEFKESMPTLTTAFLGAMPTKIKVKGASSNANDIIDPRLGLMVSIALYTYRPQSLKFVQSLNGIQMWRSGASQKLFKCFNQLGICQGRSTTRKNIDMLVAESEAELIISKNAVQQTTELNSMMNSSLHDDLTHGYDTDDTIDITVRSEDEQFMSAIENVITEST